MVFAGQDAWRNHPLLTSGQKRPFPGLGKAFVIFSVYVVGEQIYKFVRSKMHGPDDHGHDHGHHKRRVKYQMEEIDKAPVVKDH